ncbi:MAG: hypothetical protein ACYDA9_00335 [Terriglobia bacterium]
MAAIENQDARSQGRQTALLTRRIGKHDFGRCITNARYAHGRTIPAGEWARQFGFPRARTSFKRFSQDVLALPTGDHKAIIKSTDLRPSGI